LGAERFVDGFAADLDATRASADDDVVTGEDFAAGAVVADWLAGTADAAGALVPVAGEVAGVAGVGGFAGFAEVAAGVAASVAAGVAAAEESAVAACLYDSER